VRRLICIALLLTLSACKHQTVTPLSIGAILPLSGPSGQYGKWAQNGLELAREEINAEGGINGHPLEIIYEDDQATPRLAASAMQKLATVDKVPIVFGSWSSSSTLAEAPIAEQSHVVVISLGASSQIREAGDYIFRMFPDGRIFMRSLAPFAYKRLGLRRVAILYVNNDFGIDLAKSFRADFEAQGGTIVSEDGFKQGETDFRSLLTKARTAKPDGYFVPAYTEIAQLLKQAKGLGIKSQFMAVATFDNPDILQVAGDSAEGVIYPYYFDPASQASAVQQYQAKYEKHFGKQSEGFAALSYDGLKILALALRQCGSDANCVKRYLYDLKPYHGVTGTTEFDDKGDVVKPILMKTVDKGRFVPVSEGSANGH
jgi:branched-chain amino acid transport system substrate-binding protein